MTRRKAASALPIHMNGRIYDPLLGRFLSADVHVQFPKDLQSYNRYSYVSNNPLRYTDPTGYSLLDDALDTLNEGTGGMFTTRLMGAAPESDTNDEVDSKKAPAAQSSSGSKGAAPNGDAASAGGRENGQVVLIPVFGQDGELLGFVPSTSDLASYFTAGLKADQADGGDFALAEINQSLSARSNNWTLQDDQAAAFSGMVYGVDTGGMLAILDWQGKVRYDPQDGFGAGLWQGKDGSYYLAFRGTTFTSGKDWLANFKQGLDLKSGQYNQAVALARQVDRWAAGEGHNLIMVGHSLGGGLASAAANATGRPGITFNAAGLSSVYETGTAGDIRAHYIRGDILSWFQDHTGPLINKAVGTRIEHPPASRWDDPVSRHLMDQFDQF